MQKVVLLGTGNVATHLFEAFTRSENITVIQVFGRSAKGLEAFKGRTNITQEPDQLAKADIYIIAVSDDAISVVSQYVTDKSAVVAHCSGAVGLDALPEDINRGVFYPLQSFTKGRTIDFSSVPICYEGSSEMVREKLLNLGKAISQVCIPLKSEQRLAMHLAAVYTNNFTNHMLYKASQVCKKNNLPFSLLIPLLSETVGKLSKHTTPYDAQTGPARRNDKQTQEKHLQIIPDKIDKEIYSLLSESIRTTYGG